LKYYEYFCFLWGRLYLPDLHGSILFFFSHFKAFVCYSRMFLAATSDIQSGPFFKLYLIP
jgi:hypothetical protein